MNQFNTIKIYTIFTQQKDTNSIQVPTDYKLGDIRTYTGPQDQAQKFHGLTLLQPYRVCSKRSYFNWRIHCHLLFQNRTRDKPSLWKQELSHGRSRRDCPCQPAERIQGKLFNLTELPFPRAQNGQTAPAFLTSAGTHSFRKKIGGAFKILTFGDCEKGSHEFSVPFLHLF